MADKSSKKVRTASQERERKKKLGTKDWASSDSGGSISDHNDYPEQIICLSPEVGEGDVLDYMQPRALFRKLVYRVHSAPDGSGTAVDNLENMFLFILDRTWLLTTATITAIRIYANYKWNIEFLWGAVKRQMLLRGNMDHATFLYKTFQIDHDEMVKRTLAFFEASDKLYVEVAMAPRHARSVTTVGYNIHKLHELLRKYGTNLGENDLPVKSILNSDPTDEMHRLFQTPVLYNPQPDFTLLNNALGLSLTQYMRNNSVNYPDPIDATRQLWKKIEKAFRPLVKSNIEGLETEMTKQLKSDLARELQLGEILYNRGTITIKDILGIYADISRPLMGVQMAILRKAIEDAPPIEGVVDVAVGPAKESEEEDEADKET